MKHSPDDVFRRLYTANFTAILNYLLRRVRGPDDAADLVAETFLVAWRRRADLPPEAEARLWLYGVARLVLSNHRRGEQRRHQLGDRLRLELREDPTLNDPAADLVEVLAVDSALAALEDTDREVLELSVWEQLGPKEIAVLLDLSPHVVRSRLFRARTKMRLRLQTLPTEAKTSRSSGNTSEEENNRSGRGHVPDVRTALAPKEGRKA